MTLRDDIKTRLQANAALMALATGGVWMEQPQPGDMPDPPIDERGDARLQPCVVIDEQTTSGFGPFATSVQRYIHLLLYAPTGRECEALLEAAYTALGFEEDVGEVHIGGYLITWFDDDRRAIPDEGYRTPELYMRSRYRATGERR